MYYGGTIRRNKIKRSLKLFHEDCEWSMVIERARIILFWRRRTLDINILRIETQLISCRVRLKSDNKEGKLSLIYGASTTTEREELWQLLRHEDTK